MAAPLTGGSLQASSLLVGRPVLFKSDTTYNGFPGLCRLASGRLVATWYSAAAHPSSTPGAVIKSAYSDDQGATWSAAVTILTPDATHAYRALNLTTLANGTIQGIGWVADNTTLASVFTVASTDSGVTWSAPVTITQPFTRLSGIEAPIVVLANGTWVACAYGSNSASNNYSVAVGTSTDQGTTWSWSTTADGIADAVAYTEPDPDAIALGLTALMDDPARRAQLGVAGHQRSLEFTWAASAEAHLASYTRALST